MKKATLIDELQRVFYINQENGVSSEYLAGIQTAIDTVKKRWG